MYTPSYEEALKQFTRLCKVKEMTILKLSERMLDSRLTSPLRIAGVYPLDIFLDEDVLFEVIYFNGD